MELQSWKIDRIRALTDEVKQLHPTLNDLFLKLPGIKTVHNTHGPSEMGADFILVRDDPALLQERYIGVIVKADDIKQDHTDLKRQIDECGVERKIEGGKKSIFINEIWIITSQKITNNAKEKLHKDHKSSNVSFIDGENLANLIERNYPEYWDFKTAKLSNYITAQQNKLTTLGQNYSLLPSGVGNVRVEQQIYSVPKESKTSFRIRTSEKTTSLLTEIKKRRAIFIQGGMGSGKSELLRSTALSLLSPEHVSSLKIAPLFMTYREAKEKRDSINDIISQAKSTIGDDSYSIALLIDGMDEVPDANDEKVAFACEMSNSLLSDDKTKLIITSRSIDEVVHHNNLIKSFDMFAMAPLAFGSLVTFIRQICAGMDITDRLRDDLHKSPLLKALPRTPLSAILLAKLLSEKIKDLPSTLPELYSKYTELVLGRWDINKGNGSEKEYETIYRLTANLATYMLDNDLDKIATSEVKRLFDDYLSQRNTGQDSNQLFDGFVSRREIIAHDRDNKTVQFRHRTFMEFFYSQNRFWLKGRDAPIESPFDPYWKAVEYFYLGLVKDAPERIKMLAAIAPDDDLEVFIKTIELGPFMLAAYQTPYSSIEDALYLAFFEAGELYCKTVRGENNQSPIANIPELQLLALMTQSLKNSYAYEFFQKALGNAKLKLSLESSPDKEVSFVAEFFIDSVLAQLGGKNAFVRLIDNHQSELDWSIRIGITCSAHDSDFTNDSLRRYDKKMRRSVSTNFALRQFIEDIERTPIKDRSEKLKLQPAS
ncbi:NACHT domain-containing protein [Burkholderia glumae]